MPDWAVPVLLSALGSVGLWEFLRTWMERRSRRRLTNAEALRTEAEAVRTEAEAKSILATAGDKTLEGAFRLIERLEKNLTTITERVNQQEEEITFLQRALGIYAERVAYLMAGISTLLRQINAANQAPCWQPDDWQPPDQEQ